MTTLRDDYIRVALAWFDKLEVHGLYCPLVSFHNPVDILAPFLDVAGNNAHQAVVIIGIDKDFDVQLVSEFLVGKNENTFYYNHISRFHNHLLGLAAGAGNVGIDRLFDGLSFLELFELLVQQFPVNGVRMVEVVNPFLFVREVAGVLVIRVLRYDAHSFLLELFDDGLDNRCFAAA